MEAIKALIGDEEKRHLLLALLGGISLVFSFFGWQGALPFDAAWVAIVLCGWPILQGAVVGLMSHFDIKADVLVAMALVAAICIW